MTAHKITGAGLKITWAGQKIMEAWYKITDMSQNYNGRAQINRGRTQNTRNLTQWTQINDLHLQLYLFYQDANLGSPHDTCSTINFRHDLLGTWTWCRPASGFQWPSLQTASSGPWYQSHNSSEAPLYPHCKRNKMALRMRKMQSLG